MLEKVWKETGVDVQIWAARSIEKVFLHQKLPYDTYCQDRSTIIY